jgi:DNA repair protein RadA/Sms
VGGIKLADPAVDLAVMLAVASAAGDKPLPPGLVALGEVGLAGELRPVKDVRRRLNEAARLGFKRALVPAGSLEEDTGKRNGQRALVPVGPVAFMPGFEVFQAENVWDALTHVT